jgi:MFS transporter, UMF1 family
VAGGPLATDPSPIPAARLPKRATAAWVTYDLANTTFSMGILSAFYPVWLSRDVGLPDGHFALAASASMVLMLLLAPILGAASDRARRRIPMLAATTVACVAFTLPLGYLPWQWSLAFFVAANVGFQAGLVLYDALLPVVSTPATAGRVGSLGIAVGYVGSFLALALGGLLLHADPGADGAVFAAIGATFLLLAIPCFLLVREPPRNSRLDARALRDAVRTAATGLRRLATGKEDPRLTRFLVGRAFYSDAVNTLILFMGIYAVQEAGLSEGGKNLALAVGIVGAILAAPAWGIAVDRRGPAPVLLAVLSLWLVALGLVAAIPLLGLPGSTFLAAAFLLGACLGGTWSADRPLMLQLAPPHRLGELYGVYAMVGRFSAVLGPLLWALVADDAWLGLGRPAAVLTLAAAVMVGMAVLWPLGSGLQGATRKGAA